MPDTEMDERTREIVAAAAAGIRARLADAIREAGELGDLLAARLGEVHEELAAQAQRPALRLVTGAGETD